jgi:hypothetical protein
VRFRDLFSPRCQGGLAAHRLGILDEFQAEGADWSTCLDLANAMEVQIRNLQWRIGDASAPTLEVRSRHAQLREATPYLSLRGRVIVQTGDATLEGNHIEMNLREEYFLARGRYRLTGPARSETGFGARFDQALRPMEVELADLGENGQWANGLPHGSF